MPFPVILHLIFERCLSLNLVHINSATQAVQGALGSSCLYGPALRLEEHATKPDFFCELQGFKFRPHLCSQHLTESSLCPLLVLSKVFS